MPLSSKEFSSSKAAIKFDKQLLYLNCFVCDLKSLLTALFSRPLKLIWHGSDKAGKKMKDTCDRWNVDDKDSRSMFSYGSPINGTTSVVEPRKFYCYNPFIALCIQVGFRR